MNSLLRPLLTTFLFLAAVTGLGYPLLVTGIAQVFFPEQANGSLIVRDGRSVGSRLIGQNFSSDRYFWGRLSATAPFPYNAGLSGGSNLGPLNPALVQAVQGRVDALRSADPSQSAPVPVDLATASASGLDPHISAAAAEYQAARVARARNLPEATVKNLVLSHTEHRALGFFGEPRVNVLELNLALDGLGPPAKPLAAK
ncbi:MAG TPA: potassium-transporting ATPase subunit KdpC [Methylococcaceae bacterium]|nr:potassium-transporting ATPase subunit KdpC [Methylococcaceae bacterium]